MSKFKVGDKVRILDGSKIKDYAGGWSSEMMSKFVGDVYAIRHVLEHPSKNITGYMLDCGFLDSFIMWDERGFELADEEQKIVITTDDKKTTTAVLYNGKQRIKEASSKCAPGDKFDFNIGAAIALERLTGCIYGQLESTLEVKPKELLKDGMFGHHNRYGWFVVVADKFIYEKGGYSFIDNYSDDLVNTYDSYVDILIKAHEFEMAKNMSKENIVWRKNG